MIYEFQRIVPVETALGYGAPWYVETCGHYANNIYAIILENGGHVRYFRTDQFCVLDNPTLDIVNRFSAPAGKSTQPK
jgi:hypothetical protein